MSPQLSGGADDIWLRRSSWELGRIQRHVLGRVSGEILPICIECHMSFHARPLKSDHVNQLTRNVT